MRVAASSRVVCEGPSQGAFGLSVVTSRLRDNFVWGILLYEDERTNSGVVGFMSKGRWFYVHVSWKWTELERQAMDTFYVISLSTTTTRDDWRLPTLAKIDPVMGDFHEYLKHVKPLALIGRFVDFSENRN